MVYQISRKNNFPQITRC